jgi:hypothetical protein
MIETTAVNVGTTPVLIASSVPGRPRDVKVRVYAGSSAVFIGNSTVSPSNGIFISGQNSVWDFTIVDDDLFAVVDNSAPNVDIRVWMN